MLKGCLCFKFKLFMFIIFNNIVLVRDIYVFWISMCECEYWIIIVIMSVCKLVDKSIYFECKVYWE